MTKYKVIQNQLILYENSYKNFLLIDLQNFQFHTQFLFIYINPNSTTFYLEHFQIWKDNQKVTRKKELGSHPTFFSQVYQFRLVSR